MTIDKRGPGISITQPTPETIQVIEGSGAARILGVIALIGGALLVWSSRGNLIDLAFLVGVLLTLFGAAVATQRYVMTLDRVRGRWSYGGELFFLIPFKSNGSLTTLGPVRIRKRATALRSDHLEKPIVTHGITIEARNTGSGPEELRFGENWSIEEAQNLASMLAEFLRKPVLDESTKDE